MYINKMKSNILILSENQYTHANKVVEIDLNEMLKFFYCKDVIWDYIGEDLFTGCSNALKRFEIMFGEDVKEAEPKMYKLVKFPSKGIIRLCSQGNAKKSYKNTLIIDENAMKNFICDAKRYGKYVELHFKGNAQKYRNWENYIDIKVKESLNK